MNDEGAKTRTLPYRERLRLATLSASLEYTAQEQASVALDAIDEAQELLKLTVDVLRRLRGLRAQSVKVSALHREVAESWYAVRDRVDQLRAERRLALEQTLSRSIPSRLAPAAKESR